MMSPPTASRLRLLACIASYGRGNDKYLRRVIREYQSLPYETQIVVLSNIPRKDLEPETEVIVGLPSQDPWSLPFGHKKLFADRLNEYDLFVYSENDILLTRQNVEAFVAATAALKEDEVAGFFRFECDPDGRVFYPEAHGTYHWDPASVVRRGAYVCAFFTNEHAAVYILTRNQLRRAIESAGFLVEPHQGRYDLLVSAATDPYTQCGFTKLLCISHFQDFLVHHLPNKYLDNLGTEARYVNMQIDTMLEMKLDRTASLIQTHPQLCAPHLCKNYYEPARLDLASLIPEHAASVLSIGCGWGATEEVIAGSRRVVAIPLDGVISVCAEARGIEVILGDLDDALGKLSSERFDCVLVSNLLHLLEEPEEFLMRIKPVMSKTATVLASVPNLTPVQLFWKKVRHRDSHRGLGNYNESGIHRTSRGIVRRWASRSGLRIERFVDVLPAKKQRLCKWGCAPAKSFLASEIIAVATAS